MTVAGSGGSSVVELDQRAVTSVMGVVGQVRRDDLDRATPCAAWTLRELLAHMAAQHRGFAAAASGSTTLADWQVDDAEPDPVAAHQRAAGLVIKAFKQPGMLTRALVLPELNPTRPFPAAQAIGFHLVDYVAHGWDVARATGTSIDFDDEVLTAAMVVAEEVPDGKPRLAPGALFAPMIAVPPASPLLDRVVARLGRSPAWPA